MPILFPSHTSASVVLMPANRTTGTSVTAPWRVSCRTSCSRVSNNTFYTPNVKAQAPNSAAPKVTRTTTCIFITIYHFVFFPNNAKNKKKTKTFSSSSVEGITIINRVARCVPHANVLMVRSDAKHARLEWVLTVVNGVTVLLRTNEANDVLRWVM